MIDAADKRRKTGRAPARYRANRVKCFVRDSARRVWRARVVLAAVAVASAALWGAVYYGLHAERFRVKVVLINDCPNVPKPVLMKKIRISGRESIFSVDLERIRAGLEREPWIAEVGVRRCLPDRLQVRAVEHVPVAVVHLDDDFYYLDDRGRIFKRVGRGEPMDFPIVTGLTRDDVLEGPDARANLAGALELASMASARADSFGGLSEVRVGPLGDFTIVTEREGLVVRLGSDRFADKIERLGVVLAELGSRSRDVARIDLAVDGRAVVRMTSTARGDG